MELIFLIVVILFLIYFMQKHLKKEILNINNKNKPGTIEDDIDITFVLHGEPIYFDTEIGDELTLWRKPDSNRIFVFDSKTYLGEGKLGEIPYTVYNRIANQFVHLESICKFIPYYEASLLYLTKGKATINLKLYSENKIINKLKDIESSNLISLKEKIEKKYNIRKAVKIKFNLLKDIPLDKLLSSSLVSDTIRKGL